MAELLTGFHSVAEALRARRRVLRRLWLRDGGGARGAALRELAERAGVPVADAKHGDAPAGADAWPQGVALEAGALPRLGLAEALAAPPRLPGARLLVALDGVEDPQNFGAIARVAEAAGADALLVASRRQAPASSAASRASAGALEHLPLIQAPNLARALRELAQAGHWIFGADSEEGEDLYALAAGALTGNAVLVLGAEGRGLRAGILARLDRRLRIPMAGRVASLNVAAAAAVVLFEIARQRRIPSENR